MSTITDIAEPGPKVNHYILGLGLPVVQPTSDNPTPRVWPVTAGAIGTFDRIVSIEMLEAVGHENLATWFAACDRLLGPGGTAAVQVITIPDQRYAEYRRGSDFIRRYIFPGGHLPSLGAMGRALESHSTLGIESIENIAAHYAETLRRWRNALVDRRRKVQDMGFGTEFFRRWEYYLADCEAAFASRILSDLQIVLARPGSRDLGTGPYRSSVA